MQHHDLGWPSPVELVQNAAALFSQHAGVEGIPMSRQYAQMNHPNAVGRVRRWGEWRDGHDRWHLPSGELRQRRAQEPRQDEKIKDENTHPREATTSSTSASTSSPTSGEPKLAPSTAVNSGETKEAAPKRGFYKHGEYVDRERTQEEQRRHVGGQGAARQARRQARLEQYARGEWVPAWLRDYRLAKQARDKEQRQQNEQPQGQWGRDEWSRWSGWDDWTKGDETELWQRGLLHRDLGRYRIQADSYDVEAESDVVFFMDVPGLGGGEKEMLRRGGVQEEQIDDLDDFFRQYERLCAEERGAEARWALGMWLAQSQIGAPGANVTRTGDAPRATPLPRSRSPPVPT